MEKIKTEDAVGKILGADVTEIIPGVKKGPLFKRGHIIEESDVEKLLSIGKHYVWVFGEDEGFIHEDDAGKELMKAVSGNNLKLSSPSESKVKLYAEKTGVLFLNKEGLFKINSLPDSRVATKRHFTLVRENAPVAIGKVMPVEIPVSEMEEIEKIAKEFYPIVDLKPVKKNRIAVFPVGNEFIEGRRKETMSYKVKEYLESLCQTVERKDVLPDEEEKIASAGKEAISEGFNIIIYMGGISVDPDDRTAAGIRKIGVNEVIYGVPMWPGTTFLISYKENSIILGIPSSSGLAKSGTSFHRIMPILLTGYRLSKEEILNMADGGFIDAANL